ncbi:ISL3 family transposase [Legionella nagasakiensis]|uniref:ISL3 family transposase n=1 Tax=Legionella nagasakiensis TaxID=535290 RepID=UPI003BF9172F
MTGEKSNDINFPNDFKERIINTHGEKGSAWLRSLSHLTPLRLNKRNRYLERQPAIAAIYDFKQELHQLLTKKHCTAKECKRLLPRFLEMVKELKQSAFQHLRTLGNTLFKWREEVVRMLRFTKNNGITEGFHRKMKLIQRRAYGFRNFEN